LHCRFTVLGFTNGQVTAKYIKGLQPWAPETVGNPAINIVENSHGPLKVLPYGPTCNANGNNVETCITCSENGSITGQILTDVLKHLDTHMNYDNEEATPFFLTQMLENEVEKQRQGTRWKIEDHFHERNCRM
jgi:hypothetical protein